jgi:hypothetical protein
LKAKDDKNFEWFSIDDNIFIKFNSAKCLQARFAIDEIAIINQIRAF